MALPLIIEAALGGARPAPHLGAQSLGEIAQAARSSALSPRALSSASYVEGTLTISFRDGTSCSYDNVPESVYDGLISASSPGAYFNGAIRGAVLALGRAAPNSGGQGAARTDVLSTAHLISEILNEKTLMTNLDFVR